MRRSLVQKSLKLQPVDKLLDPVIRRKMLGAHAKAVAALCVQVQLCRFVGGYPLLVNFDTLRSQSERIIRRCRDEHGRRVGWNWSITVKSTEVDGRHEGGPAIGRIVEGNVGCD